MPRIKKTHLSKKRRTRVYYSPYQASEIEIQSDLRKILKVTKKSRSTLKVEVKKEEVRKESQNEDRKKNAVNMLVKLQLLDAKESILKSKEMVQKMAENQKGCFGHIGNMWNYGLDYQNFMGNMAYMQNMGMPFVQYSPVLDMTGSSNFIYTNSKLTL